ncbi:unnamed protein product [Paramecium sonneborni]|uniref:Uncharacterized protein n=1 Tax=Paramecium sonneborni TaxID=65129 RepID=A0A8S1LQZ4_9CILI|nr:unnamed protein product [Paramecium sonneborni]
MIILKKFSFYIKSRKINSYCRRINFKILIYLLLPLMDQFQNDTSNNNNRQLIIRKLLSKLLNYKMIKKRYFQYNISLWKFSKNRK